MSASAIRNFFDSLPPRDILPHAFYERFLDTTTANVSSVPITLFFAFMNSVLHPGTAPWGPVVGNCEKLLYHLKGEMTQSEMCYCIDALQRHMRWRYNKEFGFLGRRILKAMGGARPLHSIQPIYTRDKGTGNDQ